jgi:hypothetical protein
MWGCPPPGLGLLDRVVVHGACDQEPAEPEHSTDPDGDKRRKSSQRQKMPKTTTAGIRAATHARRVGIDTSWR